MRSSSRLSSSALRSALVAGGVTAALLVSCSPESPRPKGAPTTGGASVPGAGDLPTPGGTTPVVPGSPVVPPMTGSPGSPGTPEEPGTPRPEGACQGGSGAGTAPLAYVNACSGCHGATAGGQRYYPSLRAKPYTLAELRAVVRAGRASAATITTVEGKTINPLMPAFSEAHLADGDIAAIYAYLQQPLAANAAAAQAAAPYCLPTPESAWTQTQIDEAYARGLKAWRKPGMVDDNACVNCHGPDAIEFAAIGYTDSQMYRRAFTHVEQPIVDDVIDMVHALRARYRITDPPNPHTFRPFQPGGDVLAGGTAAERDRSFGQELKRRGLTLVTTTINDAAAARKAWKELKDVDLRTLRTGIPLNRWTEDAFNNGEAKGAPCTDVHMCEDHGTIADWIPDVPQLTTAAAAALIPLHDAYLKDPTIENLKAILHAAPRKDFYWLSTKYLSVQIGSHFLRMKHSGGMTFEVTPPALFGVEGGHLLNSPWMVGANTRDFAHNSPQGAAKFPVGGGNFSIPQQSVPGLENNNCAQHLARMEVPWFWLGWMLDPSILNARDDYVAEGNEYFTEQTFLDNGAYPIHAAFIVSKRTVEIMAYDKLPRAPRVFPFYHPDKGNFAVTPMTMRAGYFPELVNFAEAKNFDAIDGKQLKYMPTETEQKALYQLYTANMYRMFMSVLVDELKTTPEVWNKNMLLGKINKAELFLKHPDVVAANGAQDAALIAEARTLVNAAKVN